MLAHLATHGFASPDIAENLSGCNQSASGKSDPGFSSRIPFSRSGLVLSDANVVASEETASSYLTADDFLGLRLDRLEIIVLRRARQAFGNWVDGQGVLGLRTAIAASGAKVLIMSLWKVPDNAARVS